MLEERRWEAANELESHCNLPGARSPKDTDAANDAGTSERSGKEIP